MNDVPEPESSESQVINHLRLDARLDPLEQLRDLEAQLHSVREQLTESQRLATIGTISSVIAHEFNNILTPIISYAQFALTSAESDAPDMPLIRKALTKAFQSSTKAGKICASMLALARGESTAGLASVQALVDEALSVLARDPQKDGIALRVQIQPGLQAVCDPVQIEQVLLNLLINARQALMGHGRNGAITIKASTIDEDEIRIQVIDNGPGIPEKLQAKIFEPFFTTKGTARRGETRGTGLGLAICREIVAQHKGRIEVESTPGRGTTFSIWLPGKVETKESGEPGELTVQVVEPVATAVEHRIPDIEHRTPNTEHRTSIAEDRAPNTERRTSK